MRRARIWPGPVLSLCLCLGLGLPGQGLAGPPHPKSPKKSRSAPAPSPEEIRESLRSLLADLQRMKQANASNPDPASRKVVGVSIERALRRVRAALEGTPGGGAMTGEELRRVTKQLRHERSAAARVRLLQQELAEQLVLSSQAAALVGLFTTEAHRIEAAAFLWERLVDRGKARVLLQAVGDKRAQARLLRRVRFK
jgi:hypothetical protein